MDLLRASQLLPEIAPESVALTFSHRPLDEAGSSENVAVLYTPFHTDTGLSLPYGVSSKSIRSKAWRLVQDLPY